MVKKQTPCPISFNSNNPLDLEGNVNIFNVSVSWIYPNYKFNPGILKLFSIFENLYLSFIYITLWWKVYVMLPTFIVKRTIKFFNIILPLCFPMGDLFSFSFYINSILYFNLHLANVYSGFRVYTCVCIYAYIHALVLLATR